MKKCIILLMFLFLLSGCSVEYNLQINEDNLKESINILAENESDSNLIKNYAFPVNAFYNDAINSESFDKIDGVEYYEKNLYGSSYTNCNLRYNFTYKNYENNNILNYAYQKFSFTKKNKVYTIKTNVENKLKSMYNGINKLTINITLDSKYICTDNNADSILNNVYTWNISSNSFKPITFSFKENEDNQNSSNKQNQTTKKDNQTKDENKNNDEYETIIINSENEGTIVLIIFLIFVIIIVGFIYFRKKR